MKRTLHHIMLRGGIFVCITVLLLTSCENFLKATQVKEEIEEAIEIANSSPILYHIIADKDSGTVSPSQATLKKKQSVNLLFTPADGWSFICWEALDRNTNEPVPDAIQFENPQKLETKAVIIKPTENLMIHPKCQLVPKVIEITPSFDNSGCDQDRTIEILFNKPVNPQTLDFTGISITTPEGTELFSTDPDDSFFETPYFSNDNKVLNIPTIKGKFLLLPDGLDENATPHNSKKNTDDITVRLDLSAVKDTDGLTFEQPEPHIYRVNKTVDNVPPVITSIDLFSTSDESDYFYKKLTDKPFFKEDGITLNWSSAIVKYEDGTTQYQNGDYSQNHVSHIYITLEGHDDRSGLKGVKIRETYKRDTSGTPVESEPQESELYTSANGEFKIDYSFYTKNPNDGLFVIEVILIDKAGQETKKQYWVIKDTFNSLYMDKVYVRSPDLVQSNYTSFIAQFNSSTGQWETGFLFDTFSIGSDDYYSNFSSHRLLNMEYFNGEKRPSEEEKIYKIFIDEDIGVQTQLLSQLNAKLKGCKRNPKETTSIVITMEEESGIISSFTVKLPKSTHVAYTSGNSVVLYDSTYTLDFGWGFDGPRVYYTYQQVHDDGSVSSPGPMTFLSNMGGISGLDEKPDGIYNLYVSRCLSVHGPSAVYRLYSPFENCYKYYKGVTNPYAEDLPDSFEFPHFTLPQKASIEYGRNKGTAKFNMDVDYFYKDGYSYVLNFSCSQKKYCTDSNENIEIENGHTYYVFISALDSQGNYIGQTANETLSLIDVDNNPPTLNSSLGNQYPRSYFDSTSIRIFNFRSYDLNKVGNPLRLSNIDYYFIPVSYGKTLDLNTLESGLFRKNSMVCTDENWNSQNIDISLVDLEYGDYYLYYYFEDTSELKNYVIKNNNYPIRYYIANTKPDLLVYNNNSSDCIKILLPAYTHNLKPVESAPNPDYKAYSRYVVGTAFVGVDTLENNKWNHYEDMNPDLSSTDKFKYGPCVPMEKESETEWKYILDYNTFAGKFIKINSKYSCPEGEAFALYNVYTKPLYAFPDYYKYLADWAADENNEGIPAPDYCTSKTWMPMANGWQIFNDKPCFVHTRFCSKNLTEPGDLSKDAAYEWEARAQETGIVYNDGSTTMTFSYTNDNLTGVPSGYYYTTICHFADGTVVMSEVKQK